MAGTEVTAKQVRDTTGQKGDQMDYILIEEYIRDAEEDTYSTFGLYVQQWFAHSSDHPLSYRVRFKPIREMVEIFLNQDEEAVLTEGASDDYTVVLSSGTITFLADVLSDGDIIFIRYIPKLYDRIIRYRAAYELLGRMHLRTKNDSRGGDRREAIKETLERHEKSLRTRPMGGGFHGGWKEQRLRRGI